jgi:hypothetical protein
MSTKIQITGLEEMLLEWGIDQSVGTKLGHQITPVIPAIANSINSGATIGQALLGAALQYGETVGASISNPTLSALLPVVLTIATDIEKGKTLNQALSDAVASLLAPPTASAQFQPQSWLSAHLGLDAHPSLLHTVNTVLGTVAATAGADVNAAVEKAAAENAVTDEPLSERLVDTAINALKAAGASITASDVQSIVGAILDAAPHLNDAERGFLHVLANGLIALVLHQG